jgi:asparagine synthase (glutamine-hydrolysing)
MCGIAGVVHLTHEPVCPDVLVPMTEAIAHRGPDGHGYWTRGPVGLGNRRLSIIDLSPHAGQPMLNETGDIALTYNGELYNFRDLRRELESRGHRFASQTDSEVVVHAYEEWGDRCVERFNGMFAFALHDARDRSERVMLARDRYGVKPLYYAVSPTRLIFGSEIKALLRHPDVSARLSYAALSEYFTFQNIFSDLTLFEGIKLLPAGHQLTVDLRQRPSQPKIWCYWDYQFVSNGDGIDAADAAEELRALIEQAVTRQIVADVPVGAYLSGGMDSSSVVAVATRALGRIRTFTGGFDLSSASGLELGFDERAASELFANKYKTEHYEVVLHAGDMEHVLPELIWHLEDLRVGQCYPNYYVAGLAGRFVTVVLSGAGGDELFAGYPWRYYRGIRASSPDAYYRDYYDYWQRLVPDADRASFFAPAVWNEVRHHEPFDAFRRVFAGHEPRLETSADFVNASLYFECRTFLHGLLVVEDKLSMAHGLETRVPFLDNDLVDFALRLPPRLKLRDLEHAPRIDEDEAGKRMRYRMEPSADGKLVLREALRPLVPEAVLTRAKQGFSAPDASWFRGESIDYVNQLLRDPRARIADVLDPSYVARVLDEHTAARVNHRLRSWSLLRFEWWCRTFRG